MKAVERVVESDRPIQQVSEFLQDFTTTETWDPGTVTCKKLSDGPVALGTRYENVSKFRNSTTTLIYEVVEFEPGRHLRLVGDNKTVNSTDDMRFDPTPTGTRVTYRAEFRFKGVIRLAEPFLGGALNKLADHAADGMRDALGKL